MRRRAAARCRNDTAILDDLRIDGIVKLDPANPRSGHFR
jgi:hypothetical protein